MVSQAVAPQTCSFCGCFDDPPADPVLALSLAVFQWVSVGLFALWPAWLIFGVRLRALLWVGLLCLELSPHSEPMIWLLKDERTFQLVSVMAAQMALLIGVRQRPSFWVAAKLVAFVSAGIVESFPYSWTAELKNWVFVLAGVWLPVTFFFNAPTYAAEFGPQILLGAFLAWSMPPEPHWRLAWRRCRRLSIRPRGRIERRRRRLVLSRKALSSSSCCQPIPPPPP